MAICGRFNSFSLVSVLSPNDRHFVSLVSVFRPAEKVDSDRLVNSGYVRSVSVGKIQC